MCISDSKSDLSMIEYAGFRVSIEDIIYKAKNSLNI